METDLYSIGAFFSDQHPQLVEEVVERSEAIESRGLESWADGDRDPDRGGSPHAAHRPRGSLLQGSRGVNEEEPRRRPRLIGLIVLAVIVGRARLSRSSASRSAAAARERVKITGAEEVQSLLGGIRRTGIAWARRRSGDHPGLQRPAMRSVLRLEPGRDRATDRGPVRAGDVQLIYHNFPIRRSPGSSSVPTPRSRRRSRTTSGSSSSSSSPTRTRRRSTARPGLPQRHRAGRSSNFNVEQWQRDMKDEDIQATLKPTRRSGRASACRPSRRSWSGGRTEPSS